MPVRNRYKVFIIDEVHQLSNHSFNALLKSIEEPPPHVVFMMATTELSKIPETVLSRSQVFEFKTISSRQIADQLRRIADAEKIAVDDSALLLMARAAEGSMRDAQSAFDQVIAFAGQNVSVDDVATVLGLVGRDLVLDIVTAVADETPAAAFELSGRAVELGYDLRSVVRELSRVVRDLLVLSVDPSRIDDPEIASESERERLKALARRFSREDLLRAFDVLVEGRFRYSRRLAAAVSPRDGAAALDPSAQARAADRAARRSAERTSERAAAGRRSAKTRRELRAQGRTGRSTRRAARSGAFACPAEAGERASWRRRTSSRRSAVAPTVASGEASRDAFLLEIRKSKAAFYNTVVAQAQKIEFGPDRVTFSFLPAHRMLREQFEHESPVARADRLERCRQDA